MKTGFRIVLLVIVMLALYGGLTTQVWSYPIGIIALCFLCFLGTLKKTGNTNTSAKPSKNSDITPIIIASGVTSNSSSSNTCSGFDAGSGGADGGC